ncbi:MAG: Ion channel [Reyranella sp.]|nr:Ion channel [Reyranella sp.]
MRAFWEGLRICWPIFSGLLALQALLGVVIALLEGWSVFQGVYFAFITGLTIGYGDLVPTRPLTRTLAVVIGFLGIVLGGLVAALAIKAFQKRERP